jgi:hypothetical protein
MGWFAIAFILGFLGFYVWRHSSRKQRVAETSVLCLSIFVVFGYWWWQARKLVGWLGLSPALAYPASPLDLAIAMFGSGSVCRFLLGATLGAGTAYIGTRATKLSAGALPAIGSVGLAVTLLAITAPNLDYWLAHATGLKASGIEIQLANVAAAQRSVVPDSRESFMDEKALELLRTLDRTAQRDKEVFDFVSPEPARSEDLEHIRKASAAIISPMAGCIADAIENGLDPEFARMSLRPIIGRLQEIIRLEEQETRSRQEAKSSQLDIARPKFWADVIAIPGNIKEHLFDRRTGSVEPDSCHQLEREYKITEPSKIDLPTFSRYKAYPHLPAAASYLLIFTRNNTFATKFPKIEKWRLYSKI